MVYIPFIILLNGSVDLSGYAEDRAFLAWQDSLYFYGYNRAWLELKTADAYYGAQSAFDCYVPYDSAYTFGIKNGISLARLAVWLGPENVRMTAGKQRILWGVARIFRPLDIFNPTNFFEPGYEHPGVNSLQFNLALDRLTSIRLLCLPQFKISSLELAGRLGSNLFKNDIGLNAYYRPSDEKFILGTDLAGDLFLGYWAELTYTRAVNADYFKTSAGVDYTLPFLVYFMFEYFHDQSGEPDPSDYDYTKIITEGRSTLAQDYVYCSLMYARNMIVRPAVNAIINFDDRGFIIMPQVSYQVWENTELDFGLNYSVGSDVSEFKNIAGFNGMVFIWAKVYF